MIFADLQASIARLADNPRIHPTTPLVISYRERVITVYPDKNGASNPKETVTEEITSAAPLAAIALDGHDLVFSCEAAEPALVR